MCANAFFRFVGAAFPTFEAASKVSGFAVSAMATYAGYQVLFTVISLSLYTLTLFRSKNQICTHGLSGFSGSIPSHGPSNLY
jgi:hypothetical protein